MTALRKQILQQIANMNPDQDTIYKYEFFGKNKINNHVIEQTILNTELNMLIAYDGVGDNVAISGILCYHQNVAAKNYVIDLLCSPRAGGGHGTALLQRLYDNIGSAAIVVYSVKSAVEFYNKKGFCCLSQNNYTKEEWAEFRKNQITPMRWKHTKHC
jgi:hypothetical protein